MEGDFLKLSTGAAGALGLPAFDAAFDRGGLVAVQPSDRSVSPSRTPDPRLSPRTRTRTRTPSSQTQTRDPYP